MQRYPPQDNCVAGVQIVAQFHTIRRHVALSDRTTEAGR